MLRRLLTIGLLGIVLALLLPPAPASAHAYLVHSAPGDGSVLDRAPEALTLSFTESVEREATQVDIVDGDGRRFAPTSIVVRSGDDTESPSEVVVGLPNLPANTYHITWQTLSSDDLHATTGNLVIGVQRAVTATGAASGPAGPAGPAALETVLRALVLLGLCTALGGLGLAVMLKTTAERPLRRPLLDTVVTAALVAAIAAPALLAAQLPVGATGLLAREVFSGRWLLREVGLIVLAAAAARLRTRVSRPVSGQPMPAAPVAGLAAAAAALGTALLGHAGGQATLDIAAASVHVLAAGGWAGSVIAAAIALVPVIRADKRRARLVAALLRAFSALAVTCLTALAATGLLMTGVQVSTVDALLTTPYGWLLITKVSVVLVAGLLGLRTARRLRRSGIASVPWRGLIAEAVALSVAITLAAALASAGPANGPRFAPAGSRPPLVPQVTGQVGDLVDTVAVRPNRPGRNVVTIMVNDTRRPALGPITGVSVILRAPDGTQRVHPVIRSNDGSWVVTVDDIQAGGAWTVSVIVAREGLPPLTDVHPWTVGDASTANGPVVSDVALQPVTIALAALLIVSLAIGVWIRRSRRRKLIAATAPASATMSVDTDLSGVERAVPDPLAAISRE